MAILGLDHVNVVVSDMERSLAFYRHLPGLAVAMDRRLDGPWYERLTGTVGVRARCVILDRRDGGCRIELLAFEDVDGRPLALNSRHTTPGLRHFALRVDNIDDLATRLGVAVVEVPHDIVRGGKRMCYATDPDGAVIELCQYGAERPEFC
ncbi:MAG: VOC family protein [Magnetospirillum sp.]|nr:VOC family protein [Magnetospirillum sp.]